jgi:hypothetical protein
LAEIDLLEKKHRPEPDVGETRVWYEKRGDQVLQAWKRLVISGYGERLTEVTAVRNVEQEGSASCPMKST